MANSVVSVLRRAGELGYRFGVGPQPSARPDVRLVELVEGPSALAPGRAIDLGCGTGRNTIYLARSGWPTVGVDMVGRAVKIAREAAATAGVSPRILQGDVTRLADLDIGGDFTLLIDGGCYHMVPLARKDAYVESVTAVAAPGARLVMVGFTIMLGTGLSEPDLRARFAGWQIVSAQPVPGDEMAGYLTRPALLKAALRKGLGKPWHFELTRAT